MGQGARVKRRSLLRLGAAGVALASVGAPLLWLNGRRATPEAAYDGVWLGADPLRGHRLRDGLPAGSAASASTRRSSVLIVGGGIAGLACARALQQRGISDHHVLELEDIAGGNSRGHSMGGMACPLGAHYLPLPDERAPELIDLLAEMGLSRMEGGRRVYDERHLCHSPQERLFIGSPPQPSQPAAAPTADDPPRVQWHDGLLPPVEALAPAERDRALADYRQFAALVGQQLASHHFAIPTTRAAWSAELAGLDAQTFGQWLDTQGLHSPSLRWYLDYCCRDDYGGGLSQVSAWAGLHYFASRHGFHAPGDTGGAHEDAVLTWPEGNAWLSRRLAQPLGERLLTGRTVMKVDEGRHQVSVDAWDHAAERLERWTADQVVLATPLFISARLLTVAPAPLQAAVAQLRYAPWLVANLQLDAALVDLPGAAPSWDNVIYRSPALGYVDAMHQSTRPHSGPTVLSSYWALGGNTAAEARSNRQALLQQPWSAWAERVVSDLLPAHPDLRRKLRRVDLARYGHAMSMPVPGVRGSAALAALARGPEHGAGRIHFAHADLSGYSVFEEAFFHGHETGRRLRV